MGILYLVRHGQASLGRADYDQLSELGCKQARLVGERLAQADVNMARIVSGSLRRQRETAIEAVAPLGLDTMQIVTDQRLDEYDHVSVLAGHPSAASFESAVDPDSRRALQSALDIALQRWVTGAGSYAESHDDFVWRVHDVLTHLTAKRGATVAITSGGVIAVTCARMLGLPIDQWTDLVRVLVNTGITKIVSGRSGASLVSFNDHAHLEPDRSMITYR
jgi:broad specificity phosphatase PhoE